MSGKTDGLEVGTLNLEASKYNLNLQVQWIQFADSKATFLLTISLALLGISFTTIPEAIRIVLYFKEVGSCPANMVILAIVLLSVLYLILQRDMAISPSVYMSEFY